MKKVLIIEDDIYIAKMYREYFDQGIMAEMIIRLTASSIKEAREKFNENKDISVIVFDGVVVGPADKLPNTSELVSEFKKSFRGTMIAASGIPAYDEVLVKAGCDFFCEKSQVVNCVWDVLCSKK